MLERAQPTFRSNSFTLSWKTDRFMLFEMRCGKIIFLQLLISVRVELLVNFLIFFLNFIVNELIKYSYIATSP